MRLHVVERPVEGGDHPPNLVAAVEQDAVHPRVEERLALPPVLQVDQDIEEGEQGKSKAGGDEDEGDAPEVLVDGDPSTLLAATAEQGTQGSCDERPSGPTSQPVTMSREHLNKLLVHCFKIEISFERPGGYIQLDSPKILGTCW